MMYNVPIAATNVERRKSETAMTDPQNQLTPCKIMISFKCCKYLKISLHLYDNKSIKDPASLWRSQGKSKSNKTCSTSPQ